MPLLRLLHFDIAQSRLNQLRAKEPEIFEEVARMVLIYAEDIAGAMAHRVVPVLSREIQRNAALAKEVLSENRGL